MKAVVAAFNQETALVWAVSVITNLRMDLRFKLYPPPATREPGTAITHSAHVRRETDLGSDAFCTAPLILTNLNLQQDYTSLKIGWINSYDTSLELLDWWVDIY